MSWLRRQDSSSGSEARPSPDDQSGQPPTGQRQNAATPPTQRRRRPSPATALIGVGALLLMTSFGLLGNRLVGQWLHAAHASPMAQELLPARVAPPILQDDTDLVDQEPAAASPAVPVEATTPGTESGRAPAASQVTLPAAPTAVAPTATAEPTPKVDYGPPLWMAIPSIGLNTSITRVGIKNGAYVVPAWDVGWQEDSSPPGQPGNTIFNGHLETIDAGRPFARLHELQPGDAIYVYTSGFRTDWVVEKTERVPNDEWAFLAPTGDVRVTLYTCEGTFDWTTRRYSDYRVVTARLIEVSARR